MRGSSTKRASTFLDTTITGGTLGEQFSNSGYNLLHIANVTHALGCRYIYYLKGG